MNAATFTTAGRGGRGEPEPTAQVGGQRLAELRHARGLSQGDVATRIGWDTPRPVFRMEQGLRQRVTRRDLLAYLGAIGSEDTQLRGELIDMWRESQR